MASDWPRKARVIAVYPGAHAVDIEYLRDRSIAEHVPVMTGTASTNTGLSDLPTPSGGESSGYTGFRGMTAIVDVADGDPYVAGFLHQVTGEMLFDDQGRRVWRHESDVYSTVDVDGNFEFYHPSGTSFRFAVSPDHEDLTGKNHDESWKISRNTDKAVHANLEVWNGGQMKAKVHIEPNGNVNVMAAGALAMHADGAVSIDSGTSIALSAPRIDIN